MAGSNCRVILHIDLDCFYAQVEQKRLNIPKNVPLVVQQWEGIIAVNYAARELGITRHMRATEAKARCPDLVLVHVETIGGDGEQETNKEVPREASDFVPYDNLATGFATCSEVPPIGEATPIARTLKEGKPLTRHLRLTQKACLERYRRANADIMQLLYCLAPTSTIEKASIDEAYLDVTAAVDIELDDAAQRQDSDNTEKLYPGSVPEENKSTYNTTTTTNNNNTSIIKDAAGDMHSMADGVFAWGSIVMGVDGLDQGSEFDRRLACGAGIACRLRGAILRELGFTSSAGIASNKLLAKIGSAMHKPNQQTLIPPRGVSYVMFDFPLQKIQNFGGKLGVALSRLGCSTAGDVQSLPIATLEKEFGQDRAAWISAAVRGESDAAVVEKGQPMSMVAAKSFSTTSDHTLLQRWIWVLATELAPRMAADEAAFKRRPRTLVLHFRRGLPGSNRRHPERSRQCPLPRMPKGGGGGNSWADAIAKAAWILFEKRCAAEALPCNRLAISVADFVQQPLDDAPAITRFFAPIDKNKEIQWSGKDSVYEVKDKTKANLPMAYCSPEKGKRKAGTPDDNEAPVSRDKVSRTSHRENAPAGGELFPDPDILKNVDLVEQRRILMELEMRRAADLRRTKGGEADGGDSQRAKQPSITSFFTKKM